MPRFSNLYELPGIIRMNDSNDFRPGDREALSVYRKISEQPATQTHPTRIPIERW